MECCCCIHRVLHKNSHKTEHPQMLSNWNSIAGFNESTKGADASVFVHIAL